MAQTQTIITATDYNESHALMLDVMGLGENGWGIPLIASNPTDPGKLVYSGTWNAILDDINLAHKHIRGIATSTSYVSSSTVITAAYSNQIVSITQNLNDDSVRYTCHPSQFFYNNLTNTTTQWGDSVSLRTLPWGANGVTSITHKMVVSWSNRLSARYYFNEGNYLNWNPYYSGTGLNDLDAEWVNFFTWLGSEPWRYDHSKFVNYRSTTTSWTSGTLRINLVAGISSDDKSINVKVDYINNASANLILTPSVGVYNIVV